MNKSTLDIKKSSLLTVSEAVSFLAENGVDRREGTIRKHIRNGMITGATIATKREGYLIPFKSIVFYLCYLLKDYTPIYELGFNNGYMAGKGDRNSHVKKVI